MAYLLVELNLRINAAPKQSALIGLIISFRIG